MSYGCAQIPRGLRRHKSYRKKPLCEWAALNDLFYDTTFKRSRIFEGVKLKEGELLIKKKELARIWGWDVRKVRRFLKSLEGSKGEPWEIRQEVITMPTMNPADRPYTIGTILTFVNYDLICKSEGEELPEL